MKKKIIIGIVLILLIILILFGIKIVTSKLNSLKKDDILDEEFLDDDLHFSDEIGEEIPIIFGHSKITSFNIEKLDTTIWTKVNKVLVNNEDIVKQGQEILNVSNEDATGKIYSTISGRIYIEEGPEGKTYTIYDLDSLGFEMQVPEEQAKFLKIGQKVECTLNVSNETIIGRICYISYIPQDEQINIKIKLENSDNLKIGYSLSAMILTEQDIDETTKIYDIKNSIPKIGKTVVTYKNTGEQFDFSSYEEMSENEDLVLQYEQALEEQARLIEELTKELENTINSSDEVEQIEDESESISDYYNNYWKEYWENFYKEKLEELQNSNNSEDNTQNP